MRIKKSNLLLAGIALLAIATAPALAQQDRIREIVPLPPSGARVIHREATPVPPPPRRAAARPTTPEPVAQAQAERMPEPAPQTERAPEPAPKAEPAALSNNDEAESNLRAMLNAPLRASDEQITDKLRAVLASKSFDKKSDQHPEHSAERKAIETVYAAHNFAPLWIHDGHLTAQAKAAILRMKNARADALDPADYPVPDFGAASSADVIAAGDIKLTLSIMTFARHLAVGRIAPTRVSAEVDYGDHTPNPADILKKISGARDVSAAFDSYDPPADGFRALKAKLAELRSTEARAEADDRIGTGPAIKPGAKDSRVPQLRARLNVSFPPAAELVRVRDRQTGRIKLVKLPADKHADELIYDKALFNAIKHVQANADIKQTGVIDNSTIAAINGPTPAQKIERIAANMERWRWLPRDLGNTYVMVNIPDYSLNVMSNDKLVWHTKIVAGKPQTPTPLLTASMDNVLVNPSWYVPQSIIQNEYLPLYATDPNIFDRLGLEVKRGPDGHINVVQPPGAANALGRIKFNFPNKFQVYLHDTPEKRLFAADKRAFSHGCMRVEDPTKFGEVMLHLAMNGPTPNSRQLQSLFGHDEKVFKLDRRPMVHLTYQTAFVDDGKLVIRDDIYGFDARIHAILHSDERRVADIAPPKDPNRDLATEKSNQEILARVERREAGNPFSFFEKLFR
jgi:murein L,D-transpeptidase YcbB/YkuD